MEYLLILVGSILVNNFVMSRFLGICPFLGVSKKLETALGMGMAVTFVMTLASLICYLIYAFLLVPLDLEYLYTIAFILVIGVLVQVVEMALKKFSFSLYQALGVYLPLITTNCAVLGIALLIVEGHQGFLIGTIFAFASSIGFSLALALLAGLRERLALCDVPRLFAGPPVGFVTASLLALAFMGFSGMAAN